MKKIFVVMINYGDEKNTKECLESFLKIQQKGFSLTTLVVDNLPSKKISLKDEDFKKINLKVIYNSVNKGFAGGMNTGINYALENKADYILVHNNDTLVKEDFLQLLFEFMEQNENIGIASPKIYFAKGFEFHKDRYKDSELGKVIWYGGGHMDWDNVIGSHRGVDEVDSGQFEKDQDTDFATGCSMLIRRSVFEKVGLFDENYFLYYEDNDLSQRTKKMGYKISFVPQAIVWHKNAGSTGGSGSDLQDYFITRNRLYFGMKYAPLRTKPALLKEGLMFSLKGRENQKKGAKDFFLGRMGKGSMNL